MTDLRVLIGAASPWDDDRTSRLANHLRCALLDLQLPSSVEVTTEMRPLPDDTVEVALNGYHLTLGAAPEWDDVARAAHLHRSTWLGPEQVVQIRRDYGLVADSELILAATRELATRGVAASALTNEAISTTDGHPWALAEAAMDSRTARLAVSVSLADPDEIDSQEFLDDLPANTWNAFGVLLPPVNVVLDNTLPLDQGQVRINDVRLPEWPIAGWWPAVAAHEVSATALQHSGSLLTSSVVEYLLDRLAEGFPKAVAAARARWSPSLLTAMLRSLLDDCLPIRDLRAVLEAFLENGDQTEPQPVAAAVRSCLGLSAIVRHVRDGTITAVRLVDGRSDREADLAPESIAALHRDLAAGLTQYVIQTDTATAHAISLPLRDRFPGTTVLLESDVPADISVTVVQVVTLRDPAPS